MARQLRIQYPGAVYHVMNRGDRRERIFHDEADRQRFLETLGEAEKAERLVREELARQRWSEQDLAEQPKTDRRKARIAWRLRRETTMTVAWIARRLPMGSVNTLKNTRRLADSRD